MNTKKLFFVMMIAVFLSPSVALAVEYCKIGGDPLDVGRKNYMEPGETIIPLEKDTPVIMRGKTRNYSCILKKGEDVVFNENDTTALPWIYSCGNTVLKASFLKNVPEKQTESRIPNTNVLLSLANRNMGRIQTVDGSNAKSRHTAEQFKFVASIGARVYWYKGLKRNTVNQINRQSQKQSQTAKGGAGGKATGGTGGVGKGGAGGQGGFGGKGGTGGQGGHGGTGGNSSSAVTINNSPEQPPVIGVGPVNPSSPPGGGGGNYGGPSNPASGSPQNPSS